MNERPTRDWERLQALWRRTGSAAAVTTEARRQLAAGRRRLLAARLIESAVAGAAILVTAAALRHAGNPFEAALGLGVGMSIGVLWIQRIRVRELEDAGVAASSPEHLAVLERVRRQEIRLAQFIWIVLPLELAFLTPWWVIGSRVHHRSFVNPDSWLTVWLPILGMLALLAWSVRLWRRARAERLAVERLREQYREAETLNSTERGA